MKITGQLACFYRGSVSLFIELVSKQDVFLDRLVLDPAFLLHKAQRAIDTHRLTFFVDGKLRAKNLLFQLFETFFVSFFFEATKGINIRLWHVDHIADYSIEQ